MITLDAAMRKMNKSKLLQLLTRLWNGPNGVLAGKHAEQKMISILRNRLPKAVLIEVTDVSGKKSFYTAIKKKKLCLQILW